MRTFRELSRWQKWYLKYTDKSAYHDYKRQLGEKRTEETFCRLAREVRHPSLDHPYKSLTTFKHSGNSGDIIYSLPAVYELAKNGKAVFYLHANQAADYKDMYHPLGNVMLSDRMAEMLIPLLSCQPQIAAAEKYTGQPVDYDLDDFRKYEYFLPASITRWYFAVYGIGYDTSQPWLLAPKDEQYAGSLVIARSHRYRSPVVDYGFLEKYPDKIFLGVKEEFEDMKKVLPGLQHKSVRDFLEMATVINSCKLFIGNQSFPFSLAEALKVNRLLEVYYKVPNVVVEGKGANDFMYQPQFEYAVKRLMEAPSR